MVVFSRQRLNRPCGCTELIKIVAIATTLLAQMAPGKQTETTGQQTTAWNKWFWIHSEAIRGHGCAVAFVVIAIEVIRASTDTWIHHRASQHVSLALTRLTAEFIFAGLLGSPNLRGDRRVALDNRHSLFSHKLPNSSKHSLLLIDLFSPFCLS